MNRCIYCGSYGPFTVEHVFPFSLGGGGDQWTLHQCVCADCNNLFSALERELARHSLEAISRTAFGPVGRKRKKSTRNVPLYADGIYYLPEDDDLVYEGGLELGFNPYLRAQLIEDHYPKYKLACSDREEMKRLIERIAHFFESESSIVIQSPAAKGEPFIIAKLEIDRDGKISVVAEEPSNKPKGAWLEKLPSSIDRRRITSRIFLDDENRLIIRAESLNVAVRFLSIVFSAVSEQKSDFLQAVETSPSSSTGTGPQFLINTHFNLVLSARAIAKIGVNVAAALYGEEFVNDPAFDEVKAFILGEKDQTWKAMGKYVQLASESSPFNAFPTTPDKHWLLLTYQPSIGLLFGLRFYGTGGYIVKLADKKPDYFQLETFDLITIDYLARQTKRLTPGDLLALFQK